MTCRDMNRHQMNRHLGTALGHRGGLGSCATHSQAGMRFGLTLLEVLLALLVLVVALSGISALIFSGRYSAADAQGLTQAQLLCEGKLDSIVAGVDAAESSRGVFKENPDYMYEVSTDQPGTPGLLSVRVKVSQNPAQFDNPIEFTLVRWMPDPNFASETAQ